MILAKADINVRIGLFPEASLEWFPCTHDHGVRRRIGLVEAFRHVLQNRLVTWRIVLVLNQIGIDHENIRRSRIGLSLDVKITLDKASEGCIVATEPEIRQWCSQLAKDDCNAKRLGRIVKEDFDTGALSEKVLVENCIPK